MSTNSTTYNGRNQRMNVRDLTVGQELVRVITRTSTWAPGRPIVRREVPVTVKALSKTRLVVETAGGTVYRVLVDNSEWGKGNVKDILEGEARLSYGYREDFVLHTPDDADLIADRERVAKHNAQAVPAQEARIAVAAAGDLTKETAEAAIKALQAYVASLDA